MKVDNEIRCPKCHVIKGSIVQATYLVKSGLHNKKQRYTCVKCPHNNNEPFTFTIGDERLTKRIKTENLIKDIIVEHGLEKEMELLSHKNSSSPHIVINGELKQPLYTYKQFWDEFIKKYGISYITFTRGMKNIHFVKQ